jgi:hypothetical protein
VAGINRCVQALFAVLVVFSLQLRGFNNQEMRVLLAQLLGIDSANYPIGRMTYDLRRLGLHSVIERIPHRHRYQLTPDGLLHRAVLLQNLRPPAAPKLAEIIPRHDQSDPPCAPYSTDSTAKSTPAVTSNDWLHKLDSFESHF